MLGTALSIRDRMVNKAISSLFFGSYSTVESRCQERRWQEAGGSPDGRHSLSWEAWAEL